MIQKLPNADPLTGFPAVTRFRFDFQTLEPVSLPAYSGSAWRGLLGHGLLRTVCVTRQKSCDGCLLEGSCVYSTFYESPARGTRVTGRGKAAPHPFVLSLPAEGPRRFETGTSLWLGISLIGPAQNTLPYLIHALSIAGERGIGKGQGRFRLIGVEAEQVLGSREWQEIYSAQAGRLGAVPGVLSDIESAPALTRLVFLTPLRIKRHGKLIGPDEFTAEHLVQQLRRRLDLLTCLYADRDAELDWQPFEAAGQRLRIADARLTWRDWTRYSSRQGESMQMGGLVGELTLEGEGLSEIWPYLWHGQWVHLGKATSMGLGRYRLRDIASL